ncbi:MAG TPA: undecaprenyl-diphosphatase UppP [Vicinamibacterales bacterium]|nr:undecaprenyl-diphosphatase UppP [Vicinamibacterales bacterium]
MTLPAAVLLGILQGLTEFLPVSSSAHLILARAFFGWETPPEFGLAFDVALHVGTLGAILAFFRREVAGMAASLPSALGASPDPPARLAQAIAVGTIPVVLVGLLFTDFIEQVLRTPEVAAGALAIGAAAMLAAERLGPRSRVEGALTWLDAFLIGCAQASALIPGVSRSGATIAVGMFLGYRRDAAARFTFLLAIPAMLAAAAKEAMELRDMGLPGDSLQIVGIGLVVSAAVGYVTVKYFLRFLAGHRLDVFAYYRLLLAGWTVGWLITR